MSLATIVKNLDEQFVPMTKWGNDHWSTLAYVETRIVDHGGYLKDANMRGRDPKYPTRLKGGEVVEMHSDYDCLEDMIYAGIATVSGDDKYELTDYGWKVAGALRRHISTTGKATFVPPSRKP